MVGIQEADFTAERPLRLHDTTAQLKKLNQAIEFMFELMYYQRYSKWLIQGIVKIKVCANQGYPT